MAHSVAEAAARAVKNSERKQVETRTPEQRLSDIRKNRAAKLFVTPDDVDFLLAAYESQHETMCQNARIMKIATENDILKNAEIDDLKAQVAALTAIQQELAHLRAQLDEFRACYEQENSSLKVDFGTIPADQA